jgi:putative spermidine/putrescine transport system ATP-binding protein
VIVAIRPSDLTPIADGPIEATVASLEYRGEAYFGTAMTAQGQELFFRAGKPLDPGTAVRLGAPADKVLVYDAGTAS